ncbi:MAG: hypothetical protein JWP81_4968 [Ferruginibacter sp.]|nr:hypothetical protein [Ferruginibacter sp.]
MLVAICFCENINSLQVRNDELTYEPVNSGNWKKLEEFFETRGGPHNCWCMVWRNMKEGAVRSKKEDKKASLKYYVDAGIPVGLLNYFGSELIAWCSIALRSHYRNLSGDESIKDVWSIVCFFIKREYRNSGLTQQLIPAALEYAKDNGAKYVEAYPVEQDSPGYRFMGFKSTFEKMGFEFKYKAGQRRNVMVIKL